MWYVANIISICGYYNYADSIGGTICSLFVQNTHDNTTLLIHNSGYCHNLIKAEKDYIDKFNSQLVSVNFHNLDSLKLELNKYNIVNGKIFGLSYNNYDVFTTTKFGLKLYDYIDFSEECKLNCKYYGAVPSFEDYKYKVVYYDNNLRDFTTLDKIIFNKDCIIDTDNNIIKVIDETENMSEQCYKIVNKIGFTKLMTLRGI